MKIIVKISEILQKSSLFFLVLGFIIFSAYKTEAQTAAFKELTAKTQQSYLDRGYKLVSYIGDSITDIDPLATSVIDLDYNTYYIVLVQLDGCLYCDYELKFVDSESFLIPVNSEFFNDNGIKQATFKFQNDLNNTGKYVVFLDSELPYFANIFIFKK